VAAARLGDQGCAHPPVRSIRLRGCAARYPIGSAEWRKALGLTQAQVAEKMGVTKSRVSQVERGEVSTIEAVARYVQAIGGQIQISAVFGDDQYILRGTITEAA
jgi:DNA-binding XRE family transcriptional regulator